MAADFEHLMPKATQKSKCAGNKKHRWKPSGTIEAKIGDNIRVDFYCRGCSRREVVFLSRRQYLLHEKLLMRNIERN
tara:strand:+ start:70 stop:300 length:231 start_codon:yes stop_codon:yes gene_type:complete